MKRVLFLLTVILSLNLCSCSGTKNTADDQPTTSSADSLYPLVVSFYSIGGGIDRSMRDRFIKHLNSHDIAFEKYKWGREGEIDFCVDLKELEEQQRIDFIKSTKTLLSQSDRVHFYTDRPCSRKRAKKN